MAVMTMKGFILETSSEEPLKSDPAQSQVINLPAEVSAVVVGAPGTGKTTTLIEAFANRVLKRGLSAREVLALTSTRASATVLRDALSKRIALPLEGPAARTVNSLAFEIVSFARAAEGAEPPRLLTGSDQDADLSQLLVGQIEQGRDSEWPEWLSRTVRSLKGFRTELREALMRLTEYSITDDQIRSIAADQRRQEWQALAEFRIEYQQVIANLRPDQLDSAELCSAAVNLIASERAPDWVRNLKVLFVDDIQDANESMINLLRAFAGRGVSVIAFGDPDVAANVFRGAESDNLSRLSQELSKEMESIFLRTSYRLGTELLRLTDAITGPIGTSGTAGQRRPEVGAREPGEWSVLFGKTSSELWTEVSRRLRSRRLDSGISWEQMAVVVRNRGQIQAAARALATAEVPIRVSTSEAPLREERPVRELLEIVNIGLGRGSLDRELAENLLLGPFGGLDHLGLRQLKLALRAEELIGGGNRSSTELLLEALSGPNRFTTIDSRPARLAGRLAKLFFEISDRAGKRASIEELLWLVWDQSGLARVWADQASGHGLVSAEANRNLDGVLAMFTAARRFTEREPESSPEAFLAAVLDSEIPEDTLSPVSRADSVLITTPNGVVGLEFDTVVVGGLQDGDWPNLRPRGSLFQIDELVLRAKTGQNPALDRRRIEMHNELRLLLLAASRARTQVLLAAVSNEDEVPGPFFSLLPEDVEPEMAVPGAPTSLRGIAGQLRRELAARPDPSIAANLAALAKAGVPGADPSQWHGLLTPSTEEALYLPTEQVRLSPSRIEAFQNSPMDWFIDSVSGGESSIRTAVGTLVHWAMENYPEGDFAELSKAILSRWKELPFEAEWLSMREQKAVETLARGLAEYLADFRSESKQLASAEGDFELDLGRAVLRGKIDRVERSTDGEVVIADLKTGKLIKRQPEIDETPQLGAYQLAYSEGLFDSALEPYGAHHGGGAKLVWVSSGVKGKSYREGLQAQFDAEALDRFRTMILEVAEEMATGNYRGVVSFDESDRNVRTSQRWQRVRAVSSD